MKTSQKPTHSRNAIALSRKWVFALILAGMSLPFANAAHAKRSAGCANSYINQTVTAGSIFPSPVPLISGEKLTATVTNNNSSGTITIDSVQYEDVDNSANNLGGTDGTVLTPSDTKTFNFTVPADTTRGRVNVVLSGGSGTISLSCAAAPTTSSSGSNDNNSSTKSAVVSAVSRS